MNPRFTCEILLSALICLAALSLLSSCGSDERFSHHPTTEPSSELTTSESIVSNQRSPNAQDSSKIYRDLSEDISRTKQHLSELVESSRSRTTPPSVLVCTIQGANGYFSDCGCSSSGKSGISILVEYARLVAASTTVFVFSGGTFSEIGADPSQSFMHTSSLEFATILSSLPTAFSVVFYPTSGEQQFMRDEMSATLKAVIKEKSLETGQTFKTEGATVVSNSEGFSVYLGSSGAPGQQAASSSVSSSRLQQFGCLACWGNIQSRTLLKNASTSAIGAGSLASVLYSTSNDALRIRVASELESLVRASSEAHSLLIGQWSVATGYGSIDENKQLKGLIAKLDSKLVHLDDGIQTKLLSVKTENFQRRVLAQCGNCHEAQVEAYAKAPHIHAMDTLRRVRKHKDPRCLICHSTLHHTENEFSANATAKAFLAGQPIGCFNCHNSEVKTPRFPNACVSCHTQDTDPDAHYRKLGAKVCAPKRKTESDADTSSKVCQVTQHWFTHVRHLEERARSDE